MKLSLLLLIIGAVHLPIASCRVIPTEGEIGISALEGSGEIHETTDNPEPESSGEENQEGSGQPDYGDGNGEEESSGEEEVVYSDADQELHQLISTEPIESFILRSPKYKRNKKYGIVLLVISAEWERYEREEIRQTWAAKDESKMQKNKKSLVIFLVGRSSELEEERRKYGDLLQVDIEETYRNLVYKIEVGFRWLSQNVRFDFVAKIDSDTVVHIDRLHTVVKRYEMMLGQEGEGGKDWLACSKIENAQVIRDDKWAWYVSESDYPHTTYPAYCSGPGYVMKGHTLRKIVEDMGAYKVFEVEDAFFTGVVSAPFVNFIISQGTQYTECDYAHRPSLSILNTDYQLGDVKTDRDLTAAWEQLKHPKCHNMISRLFGW